MSRIGQKIIDRLEQFANDLETKVDIAKKYTCRQIVLDLDPTEVTPERVLQSRKTLGLSQVLFAKFLGVSPKTVRAWEQGTNPPQGIACRVMDEILHDPDYWRNRLSQLARSKTPVVGYFKMTKPPVVHRGFCGESREREPASGRQT